MELQAQRQHEQGNEELTEKSSKALLFYQHHYKHPHRHPPPPRAIHVTSNSNVHHIQEGTGARLRVASTAAAADARRPRRRPRPCPPMGRARLSLDRRRGQEKEQRRRIPLGQASSDAAFSTVSHESSSCGGETGRRRHDAGSAHSDDGEANGNVTPAGGLRKDDRLRGLLVPARSSVEDDTSIAATTDTLHLSQHGKSRGNTRSSDAAFTAHNDENRGDDGVYHTDRRVRGHGTIFKESSAVRGEDFPEEDEDNIPEQLPNDQRYEGHGGSSSGGSGVAVTSTDVWSMLDSYVHRRSEVARANRHVRAIEAMRRVILRVLAAYWGCQCGCPVRRGWHDTKEDGTKM